MKKTGFAITGICFLLMIMSCTGTAQKQTFDLVSYTLPKGWQQQKQEGGMQLSVTDKKTGAYAVAVITKAITSTSSAGENFNADWAKLVKGTVNADSDPTMTEPSKDKGWDIISGNANYTDGASKGLVTLITASGYGQTTSVVLMTNSQQYQDDLLALINSLDMASSPKSAAGNTTTTTSPGTNPSSLSGLWVDYKVESSGYVNGMPIVTAGYFRKEYNLYPDGRYMYRAKNWSVLQKEILFVYETGTWKVNGNQLTITPKQGKGEWWSKSASGRTSEWGSRAKAAAYPLETVTYTYDLHYYSGSKDTALILKGNSATERDGRSNSNNQLNSWSYSPRAADKSLIDNPPGFKAGF